MDTTFLETAFSADYRKARINGAALAAVSALHLLLAILPSAAVELYFFLFRPAAYALLFTFLYALLGRNEKKGKEAANAPAIMGIACLVYAALLLLSGVLFGFGQNPMVSGAVVFLKNLWTFLPFVFLSEAIRVQMAKNTPARMKTAMTAAITLVYTFIQIETLHGFVNYNADNWVELIITSIFPLLALNFVLTHVAFSGSYKACFILRGVFALLPVLSPILPDITKFLWAIIIYIVMLAAFVIYERSTRSAPAARRPRRRYGWTAYSLPAVLIAVSLFFGSGLAPWNPVAIASESMTGEFDKGSLVLVEKVPKDKVETTVQVGEVIQFNSGAISVVHRVIDIAHTPFGEQVYITKGDYNPYPDNLPVKPDQVVGIARAHIPYIGYPAILMMTLMNG